METQYLKEFFYLAECLSFRQTAERFYVSRSVVSRHVAALEEGLGVRLVDRDGHGVALTAAGEALYREAGPVLAGLQAAFDKVREIGKSPDSAG